MPKYLHEFISHYDGSVGDNGWWEIDGDLLVNLQGGHHPYEPDENDIIVEADSFDDLDWSALIKNTYNTGWLAPDGRLYGCAPIEHAFLARYYFKKTERQMEEAGYIRISKSFGKFYTMNDEHPTAEQLHTLHEMHIYDAD